MQYLLRVLIVVAMLTLTSTSLLAQDFLSEFVEVTTRSHVDKELGFSLDYPYEWEPSANPLAESDFYVGAPFAMPSFWLTVRDIPPDTALDDSSVLKELSRFPGEEAAEFLGVTFKRVEFNGHDAVSRVFRWITADAGRHFVETTVISFYANERWYQLTVNQSYRDTRWRPRLQGILDSFRVVESES